MRSGSNKKTVNKKIQDSRQNEIDEKSSENVNIKYLCYLIVFIIPLFTAYYYYQTALTANQVLSFPLDDPWIHLTFAKNIVEFFSFSYYKNEIVTAGSTSPLYVFIAALGFLITNNEMLLSYVLGTLFFALSSFFFYKLTLKEFNNEILLSLLVCFVFIFDYWMNFIAVSGMETTLFILFLTLGAYLYKSKKAVPLGIVLGLLIWTRPDGIAFIAALILDQIYIRWIVKEKNKPVCFSTGEILMVSGIFLIFLLSYFGFNYYLSGTLLSNTYSAKIALNTETDTRIKFLTFHIWNFFTEEHYKFLLPGFIIASVIFFYEMPKRKYNQNSVYVLFVLLFVFMYLVKLPMFSRFGRYFMPMIPFFILTSMNGYYSAINFTKNIIKDPVFQKVIIAITFFALSIYSYYTYQSYAGYYAFHCKYIYDRQVKTAYWLRDHTIESDVIAAHDIGAIGFYARKKIIDIAGLINPELIKDSHNENYNEIIMDYFKQKGVTYTTFYREWFLIMNQNPLFNTPDDKALEAMYVYKFNPDKTKILPRKMNYMLSEAAKYITDKNGQKLISSMNEILKIEPEYALAYYYKAIGCYFMKDINGFKENIMKSLEYFPEFKDALLDYGVYLMNNQRTDEAKVNFSKVLEMDPTNKIALINLNSLKDSVRTPLNK
jgi:hypothetical protein